jgi:uncharacterized membrane protein
MKHYYILIIFFLVLSMFSVNCKSQQDANYGKVVSFSMNKIIQFPDFDLEYTGETSKTSTFDNGNSFTFHYQNFTLSRGSESKVVQWTSGTGDIGPIQFVFGSNKYSIELRYCESLKKKLDDDELVITKISK